jgi:predicted nucleic acid binding AN1-type Zn finger protein
MNNKELEIKNEKTDKSIPSKKNNKLYCIICNKKLSIFTIKCKCNSILCSIHRYPNEHNCSFNYKKKFQEELKNKYKRIKINKVDII